MNRARPRGDSRNRPIVREPPFGAAPSRRRAFATPGRTGTVGAVTNHDAAEVAARRRRLNGVKLRALVRDHLAIDAVAEPDEFLPGAALVHDGAAWVLLDEHPATRLGAALVWTLRRGASPLHIVAEAATGVLARRAGAFATDVAVWHAEGRTLLPAVAEPFATVQPVPEHHDAFRDTIVAGGAEPVIEHGVLIGEVRGLEVCRVVDDPHLDTTRLEVGVGAHDREAFQMLHGDVPTVESLARVVASVSEHRRVEAPQHPLNRLAAERFLRWRVIDDPSLVGMEVVVPASPPVRRANLKDPVPCVAVGTDAAGARSVIVCSVGVDLDLVPFAADARLAIGEELDLRIVLPARGLVRATEQLATALARPATFVTLD